MNSLLIFVAGLGFGSGIGIMIQLWYLWHKPENSAVPVPQPSVPVPVSGGDLYRSAFDFLNYGAILTDTGGNIVRMNHAAERLTGFTSDNAIGRPHKEVFRIVDPFSGEPLESPVSKAFFSDSAFELAGEIELQSHGSAHGCRIATFAVSLHDDSGNTIGVLLEFQPVSEKTAHFSEKKK